MPYSVQGYWIKNLSNLHPRIAFPLDRCLQQNNLAKWMVTGKTLLQVKEIEKGNLASNFKPNIWLPLICKLITGISAEEWYENLKKQIYYLGKKRDAEKEARVQKINY